MIAEALDEPAELALGAGGGFAAGVAAAFVMLGVVALWHGPRLHVSEVLLAIGSMAPGAARGGERVRLVAGTLLHLGLGGLFGLFYGLCQQRIPARGLAAVGVFHGFVIWLVSSWASHLPFAAPVRMIVQSRSWLAACLLYGAGLGAAAVLAERLRPAESLRPVPAD